MPRIYSRPVVAIHVGWLGRLIALAVAVACGTVLGIAAAIQPSSTGISTHTQLGMAACQFERNTGVPCPTCGMTTSFAWFAHGNIAASLYVQPMGLALAVTTAMIFWMALYIAVAGRPIHLLAQFVPTRYVLLPALALAILAWAWKIFIHVKGIDGWRW